MFYIIQEYMFNKIEKEFIKKSIYYKTGQILVRLVSIFVAIAYFMLIKFSFSNFKILVCLVLAVYFLALIVFYVFIFIRVKKKCNYKFAINDFFDFDKNINLYKSFIHEEDVITLGIIFEENEIDTKEKLLEIIKHYQCVMSKKFYSSYNLVSYISLIISIMAFFSTDFIKNNINNLFLFISIMLLSIIFYIALKKVKEYMSLVYGKEELYRKIESSSIELYITKLIK